MRSEAVAHDWRRDSFLISTDAALIDLDEVHRFLSTEAYWCKGIPREIVRRSIANSLAFGVYDSSVARADGRPAQIGLARVISDRATYAYIGDVYILPACRGHGLSKWLMEVILAHPELQGLRRWMLLTSDAHGLYRQFGFKESAKPQSVMERAFPGLYLKAKSER